MKIRIGTRKSKLALAQTELVISHIKRASENLEIEVVNITTDGDKISDKPLALLGGKGVFITALEEALLRGEVDIAVHSAKDLPLSLADGLEISAVLKRGNHRDVLVTKSSSFIENNNKFTIGTGSLRRILQIKRLYPNVSVKDIRGNVDTRLSKLMRGEYDGLILAAAGLERLGFLQSDNYNIVQFEYNEFLPAPCQGIIAVESRKNSISSEYMKMINHTETFYSFETERSVPRILNADCGTPLGAFSESEGDKIMLAVSNGGDILSGSSSVRDRLILAKDLVKKL